MYILNTYVMTVVTCVFYQRIENIYQNGQFDHHQLFFDSAKIIDKFRL